MADPGWVRVATLRSPDAFRRHLEAGGIPLAFDDALATPSDSPFARPLEADGLRRRQPLLRPAHGGLGRHGRRPPDRADPPPLAELRPLRREARLGRRGGRRAPRRPREPLPARDRRRDLGVAGAPARRPRGGPRGELRQGRRERPRGRPAGHPLRPLRAPERLGPAGAARRLRPPGPRPALPRRRADPDRRGPRPPGRGLRAGRRPRAAGRLPVRGREALPRLPGPRAARRPTTGPAATAAASRTAPASCARSSRASAPRPRACASACASPPSTRCPGGRAQKGRGEPERGDEGYTSAFGLLRGERMEDALAESRALPPRPARPRHPLGLRRAPAAPTTTRTCSGPRSSRRATATCRPRTRSRASPARSAPRRS